jgi:Protein of unknown function (DUF1091)
MFLLHILIFLFLTFELVFFRFILKTRTIFLIFQECRITIESIISNVNGEYANFTHSIRKLDSGDTLLNFTHYYAADIFKILIQFEFNVQKDKNDRNYERQLIKTTVNVCKMSQGVLGDFLAKMIMENIHEFIDFEFKCPFKKVSWNILKFLKVNFINLIFQGFYSFKNLLLTDKYIPMHLLSENVKYSLMTKAMGRVPKQKSMVHLFTLKLFGEIQRNA